MLGKENPADLFTEFLDAYTSNLHTKKLGYQFIDGRAAEAPQLHALTQSLDEYYYGEIQELCDWIQVLVERISDSQQIGKIQRREKMLSCVTRSESKAIKDSRDTKDRTNGIGQPPFWDGINNHDHDCCRGRVKAITSTRSQSAGAVKGVSKYYYKVSPAKRQSEELCRVSEPVGDGESILSTSSNAHEDTQGRTHQLHEFPSGTEQLGVAEGRWKKYFVAFRKQPRIQHNTTRWMKSSILAKVSGKNLEPRKAIFELESMKHVGGYSHDNTIQKNSIKLKTHKGDHGVCNEGGAQCAIASTTITTTVGALFVKVYSHSTDFVLRFDCNLGRCSRGGGGARIFSICTVYIFKHM